ncbi:MAG: hypothetical protein KY476_26795, partial [Planctomycetes bacterium]|nr:hypothetical protein [Planctomycetota bacterium]
NVRVKDDVRQVVTSVEAAAGLGVRAWDRGRLAVDVELGYEIQHWDNLADYIRFSDDALDGTIDRSTTSLGLDGLVGRIIVTR